jgi:hypothetical protein
MLNVIFSIAKNRIRFRKMCLIGPIWYQLAGFSPILVAGKIFPSGYQNEHRLSLAGYQIGNICSEDDG